MIALTRYQVTINKKVRYIKVYKVLKRVNQNTNFVSDLMLKLVDKYILKKKGLGEA